MVEVALAPRGAGNKHVPDESSVVERCCVDRRARRDDESVVREPVDQRLDGGENVGSPTRMDLVEGVEEEAVRARFEVLDGGPRGLTVESLRVAQRAQRR